MGPMKTRICYAKKNMLYKREMNKDVTDGVEQTRKTHCANLTYWKMDKIKKLLLNFRQNKQACGQ